MAQRELIKISLPRETPQWFQAIAADLTKTLARMQQQIDTQDETITQLQQQVAAL